MKILALIPSKARHLRLEAMTGSWLFESGVPYKILVEPQDEELYKRKFDNVLVLPENDKGLDYSLFQGKKFAEENNYDTIFKIDDDIQGWFPTYDKRDLAFYGTPQERQRKNTERFQIILKDIAKPLKNENLGGISFGYRQEFWHDKTWYAVNQRFQTCYVVKTQYFNPNPDSGYMGSMWQDFVDFFNVIDAGKKVLRYGRYIMDTDVAVGEGGFEKMYKNRTPEEYKQVIESLRTKFPWLKFKKKDNGFIEPDMNNEVIGGKKL